jgi:putative oxidoreductase
LGGAGAAGSFEFSFKPFSVECGTGEAHCSPVRSSVSQTDFAHLGPDNLQGDHVINAQREGKHLLSICIEIVVRFMLIALFLPFSALDKILNFKQAVGQASEAAANRTLATALVMAGLCIEIVMSTAILTGIADRLAALALAGYCVLTALLWKQFWTKPDFKLQGASLGRDTFWDFLKNLALAGGFLMLAFGSNATAVRTFMDAPLASSHPYASPQDTSLPP